MYRSAIVGLAGLLAFACSGEIGESNQLAIDGGDSTVDSAVGDNDGGLADARPSDDDGGSTVDGGGAADAGPLDVGFPDGGLVTGTPRFVFVGDDSEWASTTDGETWNQGQASDVNDETVLFRDVFFGSGRFFALGGGNIGGGDNYFARISTDSTTWVEPTGDVGSWVGGGVWFPDISSVVVGGSNGLRARSQDLGQTYGDRGGFQNGHYRDLAYGGGRVVAVGNSYSPSVQGMAATTTDGVNWTEPVVAGEWFEKIAYGSGVFVAVGHEGYLATSTDGENLGWPDNRSRQRQHSARHCFRRRSLRIERRRYDPDERRR